MTYARISLDDILGPRPRPGLAHQLAAGAVAGQVGGAAFAIACIGLCRVFLNTSAFFPIQAIAASMVGEQSLADVDPSAFVVGLVLHQLVPSLVWGVLFGALLWGLRPRRNLGLTSLGLFVGLLAWIVDARVLLPALARHPEAWTAQIPLPISGLAHLAYGLGLTLFPWKFDPVARTFD